MVAATTGYISPFYYFFGKLFWLVLENMSCQLALGTVYYYRYSI